jgi:hypothetical protein
MIRVKRRLAGGAGLRRIPSLGLGTKTSPLKFPAFLVSIFKAVSLESFLASGLPASVIIQAVNKDVKSDAE